MPTSIVLAGSEEANERLRVLHYAGKPPALVAWPGMGGTAEYFGLLHEDTQCEVWAIDPPGTGPVSTGVPNLTRDARWLRTLLASIAGPVVLVGHSWGAFVMLALAHQVADAQVKGLILLDGGYMPWVVPGLPLAEEIAWGQRHLQQSRTADPTSAILSDLDSAAARGRPLTSALEAAVQSAYVRESDGTFRLAIREDALESAYRSLEHTTPEALWSDLVVPVLLIAPDDPGYDEVPAADLPPGFPPPYAMKQLQQDFLAKAAARPGVTVRRVPGADHDLLIGTAPIRETVGDWLQQEGLVSLSDATERP